MATLPGCKQASPICLSLLPRWLLSPPQETPVGTHLLHVVLCLLHHQVHVRESEAALEILQALLELVDFDVTRFHLHRIQGETHKPVQVLHLGEGEKLTHSDLGTILHTSSMTKA